MEILSSFIVPLMSEFLSGVVQFQANYGHLPRLGSGGATCLDDWNLVASSFNAITAAFATIGYFQQADLLDFFAGGFDKWATLIYIVAAIGGLVSMAMGQPPRNYLWFFIGPAVFHWLIWTPAGTQGVAWMIGNHIQDQREVWKLAESGIVNSNCFRKANAPGYGGYGPNRRCQVGQYNIEDGPTGEVLVAMPFLWWDALVSDTVRQLSNWSGAVGQVNTQIGAGVTSANSNLLLEPGLDGIFDSDVPRDEECSEGNAHYAAASNLKWSYLYGVTAAELSSVDARDALARFMVNECGDAFGKSLDAKEMAKAVNSKGKTLPCSIFRQPGLSGGGSDGCDPTADYDYMVLKQNLAEEWVPFPSSLKNLFKNRAPVVLPSGARERVFDFVHSVNWGGSCSPTATLEEKLHETVENLLNSPQIRCDSYLEILMLYFRYEAASIYVQTFGQSLPKGWKSWDAVYNMIYGWDIPVESSSCGGYLGWGQQERYVTDLILAHLIRNEFQRLPKKVNVSSSAAASVIENGQLFNRTLGSASKFSEVYTWAIMIPYIQGIALYLLAIAYPFAAMATIMPGFHKVIFTWAQFWLWVKMWDLGFAVVTNVERSIWAMFGNSEDSETVNAFVLSMQKFGSSTWANCIEPLNASSDCRTPHIVLTGDVGTVCGVPSYGEAGCGPSVISGGTFEPNMRILDIGMILGTNLNFDVSNSYYIYIMSALYFAVPAVTGQLVLGAKAGAASFVDRMASDPAQKAASGSQSGVTGDYAKRMGSNMESMAQESMAKGHRASGLAHKALAQQNEAALAGLQAGAASEAAQGHQRFAGVAAQNAQMRQAYAGAGFDMLRNVMATRNKDPRVVSPGRSPGSASPTVTGDGESGADGVGAGASGAGAVGSGGAGAGTPPHPVPNSNSQANGGGTAAAGAAAAGGARTSFGRNGEVLGGNNIRWTQQANRRLGEAGTQAAVGGALRTAGVPDSEIGGIFDGWANAGTSRPFSGMNWEGVASAAQQFHGAQSKAEEAMQSTRNSAQGGAWGIKAFEANQTASGLRSAADRNMAAANFAAASQRYDTMNQFGNQMAAQASVMGMAPGSLNAGPRPDDAIGLAMNGMLDTPRRNTSGLANYFNRGGGFGESVRSASQGLHANYGYAATMGRLERPNAAGEVGRGFRMAFQEVGRMATNATETGAEMDQRDRQR